jgi:hypothetical protein
MMKKLLVSLTALCVLGALGGCSLFGPAATRDADDEITSGGDVNAFELRVGDCLITAQLEDQVGSVPAVPCTQPHDAEVFYLFDVAGEDFDEDVISEAGYAECERVVAEYVGPNWEDVSSEGLEVYFMYPTTTTWDRGDREIVCLAATTSTLNELTSSLKGLGQ